MTGVFGGPMRSRTTPATNDAAPAATDTTSANNSMQAFAERIHERLVQVETAKQRLEQLHAQSKSLQEQAANEAIQTRKSRMKLLQAMQLRHAMELDVCYLQDKLEGGDREGTSSEDKDAAKETDKEASDEKDGKSMDASIEKKDTPIEENPVGAVLGAQDFGAQLVQDGLHIQDWNEQDFQEKRNRLRRKALQDQAERETLLQEIADMEDRVQVLEDQAAEDIQTLEQLNSQVKAKLGERKRVRAELREKQRARSQE